MTPFIRYHLPPMLYALLVIGLSSIPNLSIPLLHKYPMDKLAHFGEYSIFAGLTFRSFFRVSLLQSRNTVALATLGALSLFAAGDELYQSLIPGRRPDVYDFLTDLAGVSVVAVVMWVVFRDRQRVVAG